MLRSHSCKIEEQGFEPRLSGFRIGVYDLVLRAQMLSLFLVHSRY